MYIPVEEAYNWFLFYLLIRILSKIVEFYLTAPDLVKI